MALKFNVLVVLAAAWLSLTAGKGSGDAESKVVVREPPQGDRNKFNELYWPRPIWHVPIWRRPIGVAAGCWHGMYGLKHCLYEMIHFLKFDKPMSDKCCDVVQEVEGDKCFKSILIYFGFTSEQEKLIKEECAPADPPDAAAPHSDALKFHE